MTVTRFTLSRLFVVVTIAISAAASASHLEQPPLPFVHDGCSCAPDFNFVQCCRNHDRAYYHGGTREQRKRADKIFRGCIRAKGHGILDDVYYMSVRFNGVPWLPMRFRWGFGYAFKKGHRGYTLHSEQTEKILNE